MDGVIHDTCFLIATSPTAPLMTVSRNPLSVFYDVDSCAHFVTRAKTFSLDSLQS